MKLSIKALSVVLALSSPVIAQEKTLYDKLQGHIDVTNVLPEKDLLEHYIFMDANGIAHYNRKFRAGEHTVIQQYNFTGIYRPEANGTSVMIYGYPTQYGIDGEWWYDPLKNGVTGDEIRSKEV